MIKIGQRYIKIITTREYKATKQGQLVSYSQDAIVVEVTCFNEPNLVEVVCRQIIGKVSNWSLDLVATMYQSNLVDNWKYLEGQDKP